MGGSASSLQHGFGSSRLSAEDVEEFTILTGLAQSTIVEIYLEFSDFADVVKDGDGDEGDEGLSLEAFYKLPFVANMPLKEQLAVLVGYATVDSRLNFRDYVLAVGQFSSAASRDMRISTLFRLYDADADGKISRDDLLFVLSKCVMFEGGGSGHAVDPLMISGGELAAAARRSGRDDKLEAVVDRVFQEASTHPQRLFITKEDFAKVCGQVEGFDFRSSIISVT